jgi:penicillin-binding protein 1A
MPTASKKYYGIYHNLIGKHIRTLETAYPYPVKIAGWTMRCLGIFMFMLFILYIVLLFGAWGGIPTNTEIKEIRNATASEVYSEDGVLLGKYFVENRTNAAFEEIPKHLTDALVATEDARFYDHKGVDYMSFLRVLFRTVLLNDESAGGGSTLSQQLAKNLFPRPENKLSMPAIKMKEMVTAGKLERYYSKEEILTLYLNTVPFGEDCYGIEAGALRFFNKKPADLSIEEGAVLVGLLKANTSYNPRKNPEKSLQRRNVVLHQMLLNDKLTAAEYDSLKLLPLTLNYNNDTQSDGPAAYFREYMRLELEKLCKEKLPEKADGTHYNIYTDGLKIYTTINAKMQRYAEEAVEEHMKNLQKVFFKEWGKNDPWGNNKKILDAAIKRSDRYQNLKKEGKSDAAAADAFYETTDIQLFSWNGAIDTVLPPIDSVKNSLKHVRTGFLAMEPGTGNIKAWVGGIDHNFYKYDHVKSKRQVGSTFKPIVYGAAMEYDSLTPCTYIPNELKTYTDYQNWSPENADGNYGGMYSLKGGLTHSVNTIAAALIVQTGPQKSVELAKKMGVTSKMKSVPAIALGAADLSLYEMVTAYCTINNRGLAVSPQFLLRIESSENDTLYVAPKPVKTRAMSQRTADYLINMMQSVVNNGTASRLRGTYGLGMPLAGKTGTTQDNTDGWFIGFTPKLVAGAWVGCEVPQIRFRSTANGQGAATALPIFGKFIGKVAKDKNVSKSVYGSFAYASDSTFADFDCPLWLPDSLDLDSLGFIPNVMGDIRKWLDSVKVRLDTLIEFKLPGAETPAKRKEDE